ncbi:hypothetical protein [Desulfosporosinus sp. FKB]|uniref:hypothetical protein n=1 Tax=Desulfosporosinus sp. FKB TaxID=1969835 RepID=UPI000B4A217E|nr:hypothetical protein [Desulfosporosinus sp. FKB]
MDVLLAVFLFSLGFAALYGLYERALVEAHQSLSLMEAANLAQKKMEQLAAQSWRDNIDAQRCLPGGIVEGNEGNFQWRIDSNWDDIPQLLRVKVNVHWIERGTSEYYQIESLFEVE